MTAAQNPDASPGNARTSPVNCAGAYASAVFSFIGTAGDHLERVERQIEAQRKAHGPLRDLLKRQRVLKARCAALGGQA